MHKLYMPANGQFGMEMNITESQTRLQQPTANETTAGNYFVANYPPFSFWRPELAGEAIAALNKAPGNGVPLGLYLHIPFCRKRCHFCYFKVYTGMNAAAIRAYLEAAIAELRLYHAMPFIGGRHPEFVYFGGGTPSYLSVEQLQGLARQLQEMLPWDSAREITFECEPGTLSSEKLKAIRELGVTRLSLGVENFNDHILEINGRAHRSAEIYRAWRQARALEFPQINLDLIAGMVEETEANWRECVARAIELQPDSVTIYQMEIPYNTTIYQRMKAEGRLTAPVADWPTKRAWVSYAFVELEKAGYTLASAYTAVRNPERTHFVYRDSLWQGADMLGLGVASFSHIGGVHFQNLHDFEPYIAAVQSGRLPIWRALTPTPDERLIRELVLQLKLGRVSRAYFRSKFGVELAERFAEPIRKLVELGHLVMQGDAVILTRDGLLQVDRLLQEFFLPEHRNARYA